MFPGWRKKGETDTTLKLFNWFYKTVFFTLEFSLENLSFEECKCKTFLRYDSSLQMFDRVKNMSDRLGWKFSLFLKLENTKTLQKQNSERSGRYSHTQTAAGVKLTKQISKRKIAICFFLLYILQVYRHFLTCYQAMKIHIWWPPFRSWVWQIASTTRVENLNCGNLDSIVPF